MSAQSELFAPISHEPSYPPAVPVASARPRQRERQGLRLCVLGSGSGGNCCVIHYRNAAMLVDAGFGPVTTVRRLNQARLQLSDIRAVCLTHLDRDHFRPNWLNTLRGFNITIHLHRWHLDMWRTIKGGIDYERAGLLHVIEHDGVFEPIAGVNASVVRLPHDQKGTTGFVFRSDEGSIGYATDLGHVPSELIERFAGVDLIAIESNYDPQMQLNSSRPIFLKRRIMGSAGHLSNQESFEAVRQIVDRSGESPPQHIVLLHRSRQCNDPRIVREVFAQDERLISRVTLTEQRRRSKWLTIMSRKSPIMQQLTWQF